MSTSVNTEESSVDMDEGVALPEDFRGNASIIGHPLGGGDPGQIQRWMGTYTGIWTINLPWRRGKWGRFVFQKPCTAGKTGDFANETGQFQVVLNEETWRPLCRRTWSTFLLHFHRVTSAIAFFRYDNGRQLTNISLLFFPFQVNCRKKMRMRCLSNIVICAPLEHYWILIGLSFMICCQ